MWITKRLRILSACLVGLALAMTLSLTYLALSGESYPSSAHGSSAVLSSASTAANIGPSSTATAARHRAARYRCLRHHLARVHNANLRRAHARWLAAHRGDWFTTNTAHWACIRLLESGNRYYIYSGAYGFVGRGNVGATMTPAEQDALALSILHWAGWGAWSTARACHVA